MVPFCSLVPLVIHLFLGSPSSLLFLGAPGSLLYLGAPGSLLFLGAPGSLLFLGAPPVASPTFSAGALSLEDF